MFVRADLPFGVERRLGASLDFVDVVPSVTAQHAGRSVARLVNFVDDGIEPEGFATGFLVSPELLLTNWHVFASRDEARGCAANFLHERTERGLQDGLLFKLNPDRFFVADQDLDFAIVAVAPSATTGEALADMGQNTLIEARPKILKGQPVNIIQYPQGGPKQYAVAQNRLIDILEAEGLLHYETDTLEGSSGSPAFSENWELIALHHAAIPERRDGQIVARNGELWSRDMGDDEVHWVANEGIRASAIVARLSQIPVESAPERQILAAVLATTGDPVMEAANLIGARPPVQSHGLQIPSLNGVDMSAIQFTFSGPVTINVNAVASPPHPVESGSGWSAEGPPSSVAVERSIRFDQNYSARAGYDPLFLDNRDGSLAVPVPTVAEARTAEILTQDGQPVVLKYHHFELMMNKVRRLQIWSAVNIDYSTQRRSDKNRGEWGRDRWIPDPRIPAQAQIFDAEFYKPAGNIDRGHIVRREDNEWGRSDAEIEYANSDTFHWTNCTPQHEAFNQSQPGRSDPAYKGRSGLWGALENHIQQSRKTDTTKACILAGPVLDPADPVAIFGDRRVKYPLRFWKVICIADDDGTGPQLQTFGFVLDQQPVVDEFGLGIERFDPDQFGVFQFPLTEIEQLAGVQFAQVLHAADTRQGQQPHALSSIHEVTEE